jgi:peptide chain release factor 2
MHEQILELENLNQQLEKALDQFGFETLQAQLLKLEQNSMQPDFWQDQQKAQAHMQAQSKLQNRLQPWQELKAAVSENLELAKLKDESLQTEIVSQIAQLRASFEALKTELLYSGQFDDHDAIVSIFAGAGGTDAQDWAQMLQRMYLRYIETQKGFSAVVIEQSLGDEAGLKSVTFEVSGSFAFAKLKGEHGVHRLVRLSPFNADSLRQTSFAKVDVVPKIDSPEEIYIDDKDLKVDVYRAGGHGGQSVNTTDSAVRITHIPTGITVAIQNGRSQLQNKETALTILRSKLAQLQLEQHKETLAELKGPNEQAAWGNQIRNYVLHPYTMVKDTRTKHETSDAASVLDGDLGAFVQAYLEYSVSQLS